MDDIVFRISEEPERLTPDIIEFLITEYIFNVKGNVFMLLRHLLVDIKSLKIAIRQSL